MDLLGIPSPDLVVNLFASAGQVLGLLAVAVGGVALRRNSLRERGGSPASVWPFRIVAGLLVVCATTFLLYHLRVVDEQERRQRTNLVRSSSENGRRVGDTSLRTLSFSGQADHPAGIGTGELAETLASGAPLDLIDVREPEEIELGFIRGARAIRYPDLLAAPEQARTSGRTVLLCHSGNRSSELCDALRERGIDCGFMVGGYEKWIAEGRAMQGGGPRDALRGLPDYESNDVLLTTPAVIDMVRNEGAVLLDVRYPGDFAQRHIPGAINIPVRKLGTNEMWSRLRALPKVPVIAVCYDKRSSFYASVAGLRLHRLGYDFRGRYTTPDEYYLPQAGPAHVAAWEQANNRSLLDVVSEGLGGALGWLRDHLQGLGLAILALVACLRVAIAPLSLKADRDRIVERRAAPARKPADREARRRATLRFYKEHGITPMRNLLGTMVQVGLFLLLFGVVGKAAIGSGESFLWMPDLGRPDPFFLLPIAVGVLIAGFMRADGLRRAVAVPSGALILGISLVLCSAIQLYLAFNIALTWIQRELVRAWLRRDVPRRGGPVVPLRRAHRHLGTGTKAARLGRMIAAGLPAPDGYVVPADEIAKPGPLAPSVLRRLERGLARLGTDSVAVRSSGLNEDGPEQSFAGVFESVLGVTAEGLPAAIEEVRASLSSDRARVYAGAEDGGVLVQAMVSARWSGVLFTEHPEFAGAALVELVEGLGDGLVGGRKTPSAFVFARSTGARIEGEEPPVDLAPLLALGRRAEALFGAPQDIEWAHDGHRFLLLQSRNITRLRRHGNDDRAWIEQNRHEGLQLARGADPDEVVFAQTELSELLPRPTPFSLGFMRRIWDRGGSVDVACRSLGIRYDVARDSDPLIVSLGGGLYQNRREERRRFRGIGGLAAFRLGRDAARIEDEFRDEYRAGVDARIRRREALDLGRLDVPELTGLFRDWCAEFIGTSYVYAHRVNIAAEFFMESAVRRLQKAGGDPSILVSGTEETVVHHALRVLSEEGEERFLEVFGHRAPLDFEFAQKRYREDPETVRRMARRLAAPARTRRAAEVECSGVLQMLIERARHFQVLKEAAKHEALKELATIRRLLLELGDRTGLEDRIFFLEPEEVESLGTADFTALADARARKRAAVETMDLPAEVTVRDLELAATPATLPQHADGALAGTRVSGSGAVTGVVRVLRREDEIDQFRQGDILVARYTDPSWTAVFPAARGIVTEVGGWLSHAAIQAREYDIVGLVGVRDATRRLRTGTVVTLCEDGRIEPVAERRAAARLPHNGRVTIRGPQSTCTGQLRDISPLGARVVDVDGDVARFSRVRLGFAHLDRSVDARLVRRVGDSGLAFAFDDRIDAV